MSKIALVIGGSGMLAGLTRKLAASYDTVGVVGRNKAKLDNLADEFSNIVPIVTDYYNEAQFKDDLKKFTDKHGKPMLTVSWIHPDEPAPHLIAVGYATGNFYDVTGHAGSGADHPSRVREQEIQKLGLSYHRVILGRKGHRWLTNQEISQGVADAIANDQPEFAVGET